MKQSLVISNTLFLFMVMFPLFHDLSFSLSAQDQPPESTALLIVDVQNFYFPGGKLPLQGSEPASHNAKKVLDFFRLRKWPAIHVRHLPQNMTDAPLSGDPQWSFQTNVMPQNGETVVTKHEVNSFRGTGLLQVLQDMKIKKLVIVGMQTHMCLEAAVRAAFDYGYEVTVVEDACATRDLEYSGKNIPADLVHFSTLATLKGTYARIVTADTLIREWTSPTLAGKQ